MVIILNQGSPTLLLEGYSPRGQLQPQSNTLEAANQGVWGYLIITGRCVGAGLELKQIH